MSENSTQQQSADLAIIGAGASGLMAAICAAEAGLKPVLFERKHKPGRKLLMCGNARCNLTNMQAASDFVGDLGEPVGAFASEAIEQFPPRMLRDWFRERDLQTIEKRGGRVFPASERASDVLNRLQDLLRESNVPLLLNSPVTQITQTAEGFLITTEAFSLQARRVLICTGGVTYPKTGSVGDGQKMATALGHAVTPYRAGLVGLEVQLPWLVSCALAKFEDCTATATLQNGHTLEVAGDLEFQRWGFCGGLTSNATRLAARANSPIVKLEINLIAEQSATGHGSVLDGERTPQQALKRVYPDIPPRFWHHILPENVSRKDAQRILTSWQVTVTGTRPLKEAMVTVGGVSRDDINPKTMESKRCQGLFFAGEVLDIDGPTGGFNLQLAFATARLAIAAIAPGKLAPPGRGSPRTGGRGGRGDQRQRHPQSRPHYYQTRGGKSQSSRGNRKRR
jgi:predicted Rossmann fold flavoprotein